LTLTYYQQIDYGQPGQTGFSFLLRGVQGYETWQDFVADYPDQAIHPVFYS